MKTQFPHVFAVGKIGSLQLKNRLVMPPMVRNYADDDGHVTRRYRAHIESIAKGGTGMLILEASYVEKGGKGFVHQLGIDSDSAIPGLKQLVTAAHRHGAKIGIQLFHGGRQAHSSVSGSKPVSASAIADPVVGEKPHALTVKEIKRIVASFGKAGRRAKAAGCDFVEIHGAHGYLITQFLSPYSNTRKDGYGGSREKRFRFLAEVYQAIRKSTGRTYPIIVRLSGDEYTREGLKIADTIWIAKRLEAMGVAGLHISAGNYTSYSQGILIPPMAMPDGPLVRLAAAVKKQVSIPVITVAKIRDPKEAESILEKRKADFIGIGRALLADPEWSNKVAGGKLTTINPCIACNQGCIGRLFAQQDVWCTVNPESGREDRFSRAKRSPSRVVVVGGGAAGLSAARTAASLGHEVILIERTRKLGGQLIEAGAPPFRHGWSQLRETLVRDIKMRGVDVRLGTIATPAIVARFKPAAVIVAVGSSPYPPAIPGIQQKHVMTARDVLSQSRSPKGKSLIVIGGSCAGAQTAEYLADRGYRVTVIESGQHIAMETTSDDRGLLLKRLQHKKVELVTETRVISIGKNSVIVEDANGRRTIRATSVVSCVGAKSNDTISVALKKLVKVVHVVGDAQSPRRVTDAMAEGALAALTLA